MRQSQWLRSVVLIALLALVVAACGGTGGTTTTDAGATTTEAPTTTGDGGTTTTGQTGTGEGLIFGGLLPETGSLAFLGPPEIAGALLAVQDINEAGGVLGEEVTWIPGDSGDTSTDIANTTVDSHLAAGVHAIIGAASSSVTFTVIDKITGAGVIQFSPANTSQLLSTYDDSGLYFRTAPSDFLQGTVLADLVAADGLTAGVIYRQEPYGEGLAERFREVYEGLGGTVTNFIAYPPEGVTTFDAEVDELAASNPDAIVVISFEEGALILETMHARGIGPASGKAVWGVDGNIGGLHTEMADPTILAGMRGTTPSVDLSSITDFTARLDTMIEGGLGGIYDYGAETYDAMVITALAAEIAGSLTPTDIAAQINDVTRGGEKCTSFAQCVELIRGGTTDIDYDGIGGPYEFVDAGEPAAASYRVVTLGDNGPDAAQDLYIEARLADE
ncbi:MAG TPA: ABC transporter substrate-binding protein [Acidimicrobiia bacterium]|nr:ABC transporter substrate-binding protein [Acidimicrobiia bacterium]